MPKPETGGETAAAAVAQAETVVDDVDLLGSAEADAKEEREPKSDGRKPKSEETDEGSEGREPKSEEADEPVFNEEQQAIFDQRVGKEIGKRRVLESENTELKARVAVLEEGATSALPLHPDYVTQAEAKQIARVNELEERATVLLDAWDDGLEEGGKTLTPAEVRKEWRKAQAELTSLAPTAQALFAERKRQMLEDMKSGRQMRLTKATVKETAKAETAKVKAEAEKSKPATAAMRSATRGGQTVEPSGSGLQVKRFEDAGGGSEGVAAALSEL